MPESFAAVTPQGASIVELYWLAIIPSTLIFLIVVGGIARVLIRDRNRQGTPELEPTHHGRALEITWTAIPLALLTLFFILTVRTMMIVNAAPENAMRVQVTGHQWWWEFRYPDQDIATANELHLPVGVPIRLELMADDVIHTFWVPRFGWKKDSIPGHMNAVSIQVNEPGVFEGACSEYCGTQHAWMRIMVVAQAGGDFEAWAQSQKAPAVAPQGELAQRGQQVYSSSTCVNCHAARVGPDLTHVGSRSTIGAGVAVRGPDTLEQWIRDPHSIKPGVLMPGFGGMSQDDLAALAAYLDGQK